MFGQYFDYSLVGLCVAWIWQIKGHYANTKILIGLRSSIHILFYFFYVHLSTTIMGTSLYKICNERVFIVRHITPSRKYTRPGFSVPDGFNHVQLHSRSSIKSTVELYEIHTIVYSKNNYNTLRLRHRHLLISIIRHLTVNNMPDDIQNMKQTYLTGCTPP